MTKYLLLPLTFLALNTYAFSSEIKVEHAQRKPLGKMVRTNAKITQLSNQKQDIVSRLSGHLEAYYVKAGQSVKKGDKVALIESITLSKMSAQYLALLQQAHAAQNQKNAVTKLHKKGLASQNDLSKAIIALQEIRSKQNALASQLHSLGIDVKNLHKATDKFVLYAHANGIVGKIVAPLHSNVNAQTLLMTLVNQSHYYAIAYLSVEDAMKVDAQTKGWLRIDKESYPTTFVQLLPTIDIETQRAQVLFSIDNTSSHLLLGAFSEMDISLAPTIETVMVKKSALSLYQGEWVVFVEKEHESAEHHDEKSDHAHDEEKEDHDKDEGHKEKGEHGEGHEGHGEHEEAPYTAKVVHIIAYVGNDVAVKGLNEGEEYVSEGVYFVKSMILKSSLGEHGH
ncbi:MAG TPA: HlyD family efflux transporter periplasmic adaptor subunit [Epsilonproteobacteria bacterium]|nr:HlyD family efflux transporter periplasmic adaptor subunit [Campylobacterota bacterium]